MERALNAGLVVAGSLGVLWAVLILADVSWASELWVWPSTPRLNLIFVASVAAAGGCTALWGAWSARTGFARASAVQLTVMAAGGAATLFASAAFPESRRIAVFAALGAFMALSAASLYAYARTFPFDDGPRVPPLVRWSFGAYVLVLLGAGLALVAGAPHVFPWPLTATASDLYGWVFLASALFFGHGLLWPVRANVVPQLVAFLAYDLVLIVPFALHFDDVLPDHRLSLIAYTAILVYSGLLSAYYLFVHPGMRIFGRRRASP